jgi:hypothetical protein
MSAVSSGIVRLTEWGKDQAASTTGRTMGWSSSSLAARALR